MWTAERIKELRKLYGEKQAEFCLRLRVDISALQYWEQDRGRPNGPAEALLDRLQEDFERGEIRDLQSA